MVEPGADRQRPSLAWLALMPTPSPLMSTFGAFAGRPPSTNSGASNSEPISRRPTVRETPPSSCRNTTQANEPSSSMSMSGESALPPPAMFSSPAGTTESVSPVTRRAHTRV